MNANRVKPPTVEVGEANFDSEVVRSDRPVLVAFLAPWSRPCQVIKPVLAQVALACAGKLKVLEVNADDHPGLGVDYEVQSVPTLLYFVAGSLRARIVGTASKEAIFSKLLSVCGGDFKSITFNPDQGK